MGTISWRRRLRREFAFLACGFCLGALIFSTLANGRPATPPSRLDYPSRVDYAAAEPTPAGVPHATPAETPAGGDAGAPADAPAPQCPDDDTWAASLDKDVPRIVYSVLTGQRHHRTRVPAVQQTWARHISVRDALVFYSDRQEAAVPSVGLSPPANERIYSAGAWRNFPALAHLHDHRAEFGCFDWVFFCDDDTYVFPRALEQVLYRHRASESKYLGVYHTARVDLEWQDPEAHIAYAHGGAGYILSWTLLRKLRPLLDACHERYVNWAGDLRVSKCVTLLSVFVEEARGLHTEAPSHYQWVDEATVRRQKGLSEFATAEGGIRPATFHHLPAETLHDLEQAHWLAHTDAHGVEWERDFSALMFREFAFACPEIPDDRSERPAVAAGQRCRLLFGFRVDHLTSRGRVHRRVAKAPDRNDEGDPATREYSPLYDKVTPPTFGANGTFVFALGITPAINARLVSFPFKRDTCKLPAGAAASDFGPDGFHGLVRHSRAVVTVSCVNAWELGPGADECPPGSTPPLPGELGKGGRICSATLPAPGCDLQLHLATSLCPQPVRKTELKCGSISCVSRVAGASRNADAAR